MIAALARHARLSYLAPHGGRVKWRRAWAGIAVGEAPPSCTRSRTHTSPPF